MSLSDRGKKSIIIVDDVPESLKALTAIISKRGYQVRPALSGKLALNSARKKPPDLILLDIRMPDMDGYEVCRRLKEDEDTRDIPIIFISALEEIQDKLKAFHVGGQDYITKPFQSEEVLARVENHLALRALQKSLRESNIQLQKEIVERKKSEDDLKTARDELEAFAYSVSHDLHAPLRAISGFAEIIARRHRTDLNEEGQHYFENIVQASYNMDRLIKDLLSYSRLGRSAIHHDSVSLDAVLKQVTDNLAGRLHEIDGQLILPDRLPTILGDPTLLNQIFTNLFENAVTYRKPDVPMRVTVSCEDRGNHVIVGVTDNGIGIPSEYREKIFDPFRRLHGQEEHPGTGIGLAIVNKSAKMLGGSVWVKSEVGIGSTFYVKLKKVEP